MRRHICCIALGFLGASATLVTAEPITIVSTLPGPLSGYDVEGSTAFRFTSAYDSRLLSLTALVGLSDGFYGPPGTQMEMALYSDANGRPGTALEALIVRDLDDTNLPPFSIDRFYKTEVSVTRPELRAGQTYWFVGTGIDGRFFWGASLHPMQHPWPMASRFNGEDWVTFSNFAAAFKVTATPSVPAPVPEPATFSLLGIGLASIGWKARRRLALYRGSKR
jgi:hypothetical protein